MIENRHLGDRKTTSRLEAAPNRLLKGGPQMMRSARALILSVEYLLLLVAMWLAVSNAVPAGGADASETSRKVAKFGLLGFYPNAVGFAAWALWFSRQRTFAPLARYLVPSAFAALLTFPLYVIVVYLMVWGLHLLWPRPSAVTSVFLVLPSLVPGLITAQLLRWPRVGSVGYSGEAVPTKEMAEGAVR
jgi:hypothetical protein